MVGVRFFACSLWLIACAGVGWAEERSDNRSAHDTEPEDTICTLIDKAAARHKLPTDFFTRLIWKESRFRADAVSPKGAQGIAQFMPGTAALRKLSDPFDPARAIPASAHYLSDLAGIFGSLGLAAAAYNAGEQRVSDWLSGAGQLPAETRDYVMFITGRSAEEWKDPDLSSAAEIGAFSDKQCAGLVTQLSKTAVALSAAAAKRGKVRGEGPRVTVWRNGKANTYSVLRAR